MHSDQPESLAGTVNVVAGVQDATVLAETRLAAALPRRWRHVQSVALRAAWAADRLSLPGDLVAAAWLHDIGYAPELAVTGFHPLDGARFLGRVGINGQVVSLVAYHSCAQIEAGVRGLADELAGEFSPAEPVLADVLLWCDMTTGPDGDHMRPADRLAEIRRRYGPGHVVTRFVDLAAAEILAAAGRVEMMLAHHLPSCPGRWPDSLSGCWASRTSDRPGVAGHSHRTKPGWTILGQRNAGRGRRGLMAWSPRRSRGSRLGLQVDLPAGLKLVEV